MKVTIREVAKRAKVSVGTASRVMNGRENVGDDIRKRVLQAVSELGYTPNYAAQTMRRRGTRMVGIIVRDITIPVLASFVRAAQDVLQAADYTLLIACSEDIKARELELMALLARRQVDGIIMTTCAEDDPDLLAARRTLDLPVVLLDREAPPGLNDSILLSHADGMRRAVRSLAAIGHRRIGLVTGDSSVYPARERIKGYKAGCEEAGLAIDATLIRSRSFAEAQSFVEMSALLSLAKPPTALIAGGISILPGTIRAIRSRGLRIPHDISVIGSGDSDLAMLFEPAISVIRWSYEELGRIGAQLLLDRMGGLVSEDVRRILFPTELVLRESCAIPPG